MTTLETILIIYLLVSYVLGFIMIITAYFAPEKVSYIVFIIWFVVALPIALPIVLYKWKRSKRKQDLEQQLDDEIKEQEREDLIYEYETKIAEAKRNKDTEAQYYYQDKLDELLREDDLIGSLTNKKEG